MEGSSLIHKVTARFHNGYDVSPSSVEGFLDALIREADETLLTELFAAWNAKGIAENEIYEIARIMRERSAKVRTRHATFVDIVGTGGSKAKTFNVSTAASFVVAGAGIPVAKHGNRAATSNSGSADVLSALGIEPAVDAATAQRCLDEIGICFMYAPNFHRLSPTLAKVRRGLRFPTIFNCVGPLCNPANAPHQVIGVWEKEMVAKMANALARLGTGRSWVVYGEDGSDELSLTGRTFVAEIRAGSVEEFEVSANELGLGYQAGDGLKACGPEESAGIIRDVLRGRRRDSAEEAIVAVNAAAAIHLAGKTADMKTASSKALDSIRNGAAIAKLDALAEAVRR